MSVPVQANRPMTMREWAMLLALAAVWGGSFFFNAIAVRELPVFTVVVARVALAAVLLLVLFKIMGQKLPTGRRVWAAFFSMGLLNNVIPFSLIVGGQQHIASGVASILNASTPLFTVVLAHFLTSDEKMTGNRLFGVIVGFIGVAVMIGFDAVQTLGNAVLAQLMVITGAASYAFAAIFGRRFREMGIAPMAAATGQVAASSILLIPLVLVIDQPWTLPMPGLTALGALAGVAALSTALAYLLYFRLLSTAGATNVQLVTFLIPVSAVLLGILFLNETLLPKHIIGVILIGCGLAAIDGRLGRMVRNAVFGRA